MSEQYDTYSHRTNETLGPETQESKTSALVADVMQLTRDYEQLSQQVDNLESVLETKGKIINLLITQSELSEHMFKQLSEAIVVAKINTQPKDN